MQIQTLQDQANKVPSLSTQLAQSESDRQACLKAETGQQTLITNLQTELAKGKPTSPWGRFKYIFNL